MSKDSEAILNLHQRAYSNPHLLRFASLETLGLLMLSAVTIAPLCIIGSAVNKCLPKEDNAKNNTTIESDVISLGDKSTQPTIQERGKALLTLDPVMWLPYGVMKAVDATCLSGENKEKLCNTTYVL